MNRIPQLAQQIQAGAQVEFILLAQMVPRDHMWGTTRNLGKKKG